MEPIIFPSAILPSQLGPMKAKRKLPAKASNPEPGEKQEQAENEDDGIQVKKKLGPILFQVQWFYAG